MRESLQASIGTLWHAARRFRDDNALHLAAGLAFFGTLSLVPLLLLMVSVFGHLLGQSENLFRQIVLWIGETIPGVESGFVDLLRGMVARRVTTGGVGLACLLLSASLLFTSLERTLDLILRVQRRRRLWRSQLLAVVLIGVTSLVFFTPVLLSSLGEFLARYSVELRVTAWFRGGHFFWMAHGVWFAFLIRVVPHARPRMRFVWLAAALFATLAWLARFAFHIYLSYTFDRFHLIYGPLTVLVLSLLWLFYLSAIFLYCSEVVAVAEATPPKPAIAVE
ncbi:MAG: YihY family inner membrane protein [Deltaproteobacteria bacterium]|nr:YihY family inner membrane protein [Deltaproteobacteria bacterium]